LGQDTFCRLTRDSPDGTLRPRGRAQGWFLGVEVAGVVAFVELFFFGAADAVDHAASFDGLALGDLFGPAANVLVGFNIQELTGVIELTLSQNAVP